MKHRPLVLAVALASTAAYAAEKDMLEEVVVTGTMIQGVDPVGTGVVSLSEKEIMGSGVNSGLDLIRKVPLVSDFNTLPTPTTDASIPFSPIVLRGVGGLSGMSTLVLLDGQRIVPAGPYNWVDADMIPAAHLERVDVIADGASSIYGSDAVGGVVNFITRKAVEGPSVSVRYGAGAGGYDTLDATATGGANWEGGSAVLSYTYAEKEALLGKDLDYRREDKTAVGGQDNRSTQCNPGNVNVGFTTYPLPGSTAGAPNYCTSNGNDSFYPEEQRHSLFGTLSHQFDERMELSVSAYWSQRETKVYDADNARSSGDITNTNPFFRSFEGETSHNVLYSYEDVFGSARANPAQYESWQITPTLTIELSEDWSLRTSANYGTSDFYFDAFGINAFAEAAALAATTADFALNPYDPAATNASVLAGIADWVDRSEAEHELVNLNVVLDGKLMTIGGGDVHLAVGSEIRTEDYQYSQRIGARSADVSPLERELDRKVTSAFAELYVPLTNTLELSVSGRYDDYDDVGDTFNPKVGVDWNLSDAITLRASWGTSFHAPALADLAQPTEYQFFLPISPFRASDSPFFFDFFMPSFLLAGVGDNIAPEEAETWSLGAEFEITDELRAELTYWNLVYEDRLDQNAGFFFGPQYYDQPANESFYILKPGSADDVRAQFGDYPAAGFPSLDALFAIFGTPYVVSNQTKQNMGSYELDGVDFALAWNHDLAGGVLDARVNGTYYLSKDKEQVKGSGFVDTLRYGDFNQSISPLNATASLGWGAGPFYASATLYYKDKAEVGDVDIDSFTTVSLFSSFDLNETWTVTLNVDNVFDEDPPGRSDFENGVAYITMPRLVQLGINAQF